MARSPSAATHRLRESLPVPSLRSPPLSGLRRRSKRRSDGTPGSRASAATFSIAHECLQHRARRGALPQSSARDAQGIAQRTPMPLAARLTVPLWRRSISHMRSSPSGWACGPRRRHSVEPATKRHRFVRILLGQRLGMTLGGREVDPQERRAALRASWKLFRFVLAFLVLAALIRDVPSEPGRVTAEFVLLAGMVVVIVRHFRSLLRESAASARRQDEALRRSGRGYTPKGGLGRDSTAHAARRCFTLRVTSSEPLPGSAAHRH